MKSAGVTTIRERLAEAKASLDYLDLERSRRADPEFGKRIEAHIVWRELLDLEFDDAEERITRLCDAAEWALALVS
ncbi:MAG: hypothetical protein LAP40_01385 [Acidobacteriia bacterium]|nr:hypothetical protein [Terriglobia bacterium]